MVHERRDDPAVAGAPDILTFPTDRAGISPFDRIWETDRFSWWMLSLLHPSPKPAISAAASSELFIPHCLARSAEKSDRELRQSGKVDVVNRGRVSEVDRIPVVLDTTVDPTSRSEHCLRSEIL